MVAAADGGQERQLASDVPAEPWISLAAPWRPSFAPAWSPDGRLIVVAAATLTSGGRVRGERLARLAWSGNQLLYGTVVSGRPAILRVTPGQDTSEEVVLDALTPGVTSDRAHDRVRLVVNR